MSIPTYNTQNSSTAELDTLLIRKPILDSSVRYSIEFLVACSCSYYYVSTEHTDLKPTLLNSQFQLSSYNTIQFHAYSCQYCEKKNSHRLPKTQVQNNMQTVIWEYGEWWASTSPLETYELLARTTTPLVDCILYCISTWYSYS